MMKLRNHVKNTVLHIKILLGISNYDQPYLSDHRHWKYALIKVAKNLRILNISTHNIIIITIGNINS